METDAAVKPVWLTQLNELAKDGINAWMWDASGLQI